MAKILTCWFAIGSLLPAVRLAAQTDYLLSNAPSGAPGIWVMDGSNAAPSTDQSSSVRTGISLAGSYFLLQPGQTDNSVSLSSLPPGFSGKGWRSLYPLNGGLAPGTAALDLKFANRLGLLQVGRPWARLWKSASADGSGASPVSAWCPAPGALSFPALATVLSTSLTISPSAAIFSSEYLFVEAAWEVTLASLDLNSGTELLCDEAMGEVLHMPDLIPFTPIPGSFLIQALGTVAPFAGELKTSRNLFRPGEGNLALSFRLDEAGPVVLEVYDLMGHKVATLLDEARPAGTFSLSWNGRDSNGQLLPTDLYVLKAKLGSGVLVKKLALVKD